VPLVERHEEIHRLRQARTAAWGGGCRTTVVLGEAGVGKTGLIEELVGDTTRSPGRVLVGRAHESESIRPFGLWIDALRTARLVGATTESIDLGHAERAELARLFPELGEVEVSGAPVADGNVRLFDAMTQIIARAAAAGPLLIVLEDLQWADEMSLRLLSYLSRRLSDSPVLVVGTAREEEVSESPVFLQVLGELERGRGFARIDLHGLSRSGTRSLVTVHARVGTEAAALEALGELVWHASEGNPLMVIETIRGLADSAAPASAAPSLPQRVRETVGRRLERVTERARHVVMVAAAIGREFDFPLLQRAAGLTPAEAAEGIEELVERRILHVIDDGFDFTHDWIRVVAYDRLQPAARPPVHAAIGHALETLHDGRLHEIYDQLADQYARTPDAAKAIEYLTRFAGQAARAYAHTDAIRALADAVDRVEGLPVSERDGREVDLRLRQAHSLHLLGRLREILELLLPARDLVEQLRDSPAIGQYYLRLGHTYSVLGDRRQAGTFIERAIEAASRQGDTSTLGKAHYVAAVERVYAGRQVDGTHHGREAVRLLRDVDEPWWLGLAYWITGLSQLWLGELDAALAAETQAFDIGTELGDSRVRAFAAWTTGLIHGARGDWDVGLHWCRTARDLSRDPVNSAVADGFAGSIHVERGDAATAKRLLTDAVAQFWKFDYRQAVAQFTAALADAHRLDGDLKEAWRLATDALRHARDTDFPLATAWAQRALGRVALATGDHAAAGAAMTAALDTARAMQAGLEIARCRLARAEVAVRGAAAAADLRDAYRLFTRMRAPRYVERARALAAALAVDLDEAG
jgi:tetratricopeptide (TPR) repeat protein